MPFKNLSQLALSNRIRSLSPPGLKPAAAPFALPSDPVRLDISAQGAEFILAAADTKALYNLPNLKDRQEMLVSMDPPYELLSAFLELYLSPLLKQIGKILETTITVAGYAPDFDPAKYPIALPFYYQAGELNLPFMLLCRNTDAVNNLLQKLDEIYSAQSFKHNEDFLEVTCELIAGMSTLSAAELSSLEEGDAVVIERFCLNDDKLIVGANGFLANAQISGGRVMLTGPFVKRTSLYDFAKQSKENEMSDKPAETNEASALTAVDELPLEVSFVVDRQVMTLAKLKELKEGSEIPLTNHDLSNVALEVSGQTVALGRIIDLGDRFGFQIMRKGK